MTEFDQLIPSLIDISRQAGAAILRIYNDPAISAEVDYKSDNSPLTQADRAAHTCIARELKALTPDIPLLSEEGREIEYAERSQWQRFWLVDPLDGTKEFVKRNGEFTVNIALIEAGASVLGVVHVPVSGETFYAAKGQGAFFIAPDAAPVRISGATFSLQDEGLRLVCSRSHMSPEVEAYVQQFREPETVSMGSSLKFMLIAQGKADVYPRLAPTMEWDTAAAHIVVEEAGGSIIDQETNQPLRYNKENLRNPHFIAFGQVKGA